MGKPEPFPAQLAQPQHCSNKLQGFVVGFFLLFASPLFLAAFLMPWDLPSVPSRGECICCCSNAIPAHQLLQELIKKGKRNNFGKRTAVLEPRSPRAVIPLQARINPSPVYLHHLQKIRILSANSVRFLPGCLPWGEQLGLDILQWAAPWKVH